MTTTRLGKVTCFCRASSSSFTRADSRAIFCSSVFVFAFHQPARADARQPWHCRLAGAHTSEGQAVHCAPIVS